MSTCSENKLKIPTRHLGRTGLKVPIFSLGTWLTFGLTVDEDLALEMLETAYKYGVNFIDTAEVYADGKAEIVLGKALKRGTWKRSDMVITTKIFWTAMDPSKRGPNDAGLSRKHLIEGLTASLKRLQLDYVDVVFCHRPDPDTPMEETVRAMNYILDKGLAFYWGTSEWSAEEITKAWEIANRLHLIGPCVEQPEYNMINLKRVEEEYKRVFEDYGIGTTVWSPLAGGLLTGKYSNGNPPNSRFSNEQYEAFKERFGGDKTIEVTKKLTVVAAKVGCTPAQLALIWCLKNKNVTNVILGATSIKQLEENIRSYEFFDKLTPQLLEEIRTILNSNK